MIKKTVTATPVESRIKGIFLDRNISAMAARTGYPESTLRYWARNPSAVKAGALMKLECIYGKIGSEGTS